jgi:hypothetical protein
MSNGLLQLNLSQLSRAWEKSKFNNYSDKKKSEHIGKLTDLHKLLIAENVASLNENDIVQRSHVIKFFFKNLEFLENSTLNSMPYEIVECLKHALSEWIDSASSYIIVTSLINDLASFSFDPSLAINNTMLNGIIQANFGLHFDYKLIQINIPRFLVKDYLVNVVLYHELGHFVDMYHNITPICARALFQLLGSKNLQPAQITQIEEYFPFLSNLVNQIAVLPQGSSIPLSNDLVRQVQLHFGEYFCDLFASQYIDECSNNYLLYITENQGQFSYTHPSTNNRSKMVKAFLGGQSNFVLELIKGQTKMIARRDIFVRNEALDKDDFYNLIPVEISKPEQLHSLFVIGWEIWLADKQKFTDNNNIKFPLTDDKVYGIINNLIEKSIANYFVKNSWENIKTV